jgi:hypothetical protein
VRVETEKEYRRATQKSRIGELFIRPHLERPLLGKTYYYFCTPVLKLLEPLSFSPPFLPLFVKFCPCFARFEPSYVYGPAPSATALVIACRAGHLCLAYQLQIAYRLIVARWRWLGCCGFGCRFDHFDLLYDILASRGT